MLRVGISGTTSEEHERALVGAPRLEFDDPVLTDLFVLRVVMHVLALGVIDASDLGFVNLIIPRV